MKNCTIFLPHLTILQFRLYPASAVLLEQVDYQGSEHDTPPRCALIRMGPSLPHQSS